MEPGCRMSGLRMKRSGIRWSERGANAMLALKCCVMNQRLADLLDWGRIRPPWRDQPTWDTPIAAQNIDPPWSKE